MKKKEYGSPQRTQRSSSQQDGGRKERAEKNILGKEQRRSAIRHCERKEHART
jgi:hypothetical protein